MKCAVVTLCLCPRVNKHFAASYRSSFRTIPMAKSSSSLWRSLRHRNYRLYLTGQIVSVCGTWMQQVAQSWIVYRLTGSATLLGVVSFASQAPVFAFASIGGVMTDRYAPRRLLLWTQSTALLQALLLALLTFTGWIHVA